MYSTKKLNPKTMPLTTAVTITLGGNKPLLSRFRFAALTPTVTEAYPQWSM